MDRDEFLELKKDMISSVKNYIDNSFNQFTFLSLNEKLEILQNINLLLSVCIKNLNTSDKI